MEVVGQDPRAPSYRLNGVGVDLEELLRVDGAVILPRQVGRELGGPVDPQQVRH